MDIGWLKTARDRMMAEAPQVAEKLGAIYILRPTAWLRTLLGMASAFLSAETANRMVLLDTDAALGEHVELGSLSLPPGVAIEGVPKRPGAPAGLLAGDYDDDVPAAAAAAGGGAAAGAMERSPFGRRRRRRRAIATTTPHARRRSRARRRRAATAARRRRSRRCLNFATAANAAGRRRRRAAAAAVRDRHARLQLATARSPDELGAPTLRR